MSVDEDNGESGGGGDTDTMSTATGMAGTLENFKEVEEVKTIISNIEKICDDQISVELTQERMQVIFDQYQEQAHLLDQHLESLLASLLSIARSSKVSVKVSHFAFKLIYLVTKTRGYKVVVRLLPHEVADLEPVLALLAKQKVMDFENWETRYILLLWLSIVCMIPFDMSRLDSHRRIAETGEVRAPIMERIIDAGVTYLSVSDKSRDAAAYMLSHFMTRPDVKVTKLPQFLDWCLQRFDNADIETMPGMTALSGVLATLAMLFKLGKREDIVDSAAVVLDRLMAMNLKDRGNIVLRKLSIKLIQRLGLTFLKAKVAAWRYQRGSRSLMDNLTDVKGEGQIEDVGNRIEDDDEYDIPEAIENIIEELLSGLKDKDTVVRWSAAKGVGRLTSRLPRQLADEVVAAIMQLFTTAETDGAWHGGCLALAELGRRGLLLPHRLADVVPVIIKALLYDERKGNFSVGAHVRDAACYVCWAFARAYDPQQMKPYVCQIANSLVIVSIFDREVNVRRAASAAFQENVGRQGQFSHGIDILTTCDYFAVGNRTHCYIDLSVFVAQYDQYTEVLIEHLVSIKGSHWDGAIRELCAKAMYHLTAKAPLFMAKKVLPRLVKMCTDLDLNVRHGALLSAGFVTHALAVLASQDGRSIVDLIDSSIVDQLRDVTLKLQEAKLFRGLGGEFMKKGTFCMIEKLSLAKMPYHGHKIIDVWQDVINESLQQTEVELQTAALAALPAFLKEYYVEADGSVKSQTQERLLSGYLAQLASHLEVTRCGFCLALGAVPAALLRGKLASVLPALLSATRVTGVKDAKWVAARRDAVTAVTSLCQTVGVSRDVSEARVGGVDIDAVYAAFFTAMTDYTLDSRGDVGAWVRESAMRGLQQITVQIVSGENGSLISAERCRKLFCCLVQQAAEKIDRTRIIAGRIFCNLLHHKPTIPHIPHREKLLELFPLSAVKDVSWSCPSDSFHRFTPLLALQTYTYPVLLGLTVSVGGLTESLVKYSAGSLFSHLREISTDRQKTETFSKVLLQIFADYQKVDRVSLSMMKMLDQLLAKGCFTMFSEDENHTFPLSVLQLTKQEVGRSGDPQKILASIDVFCGLLQYMGDVRTRTLVQLLIMLCHRYPIVRKTAAGKLYESLVTYDGLVDDDQLDDALAILSDVSWDQSISLVKPHRNQLCDLLRVPRPVAKTPVSSSTDMTAEH